MLAEEEKGRYCIPLSPNRSVSMETAEFASGGEMIEVHWATVIVTAAANTLRRLKRGGTSVEDMRGHLRA